MAYTDIDDPTIYFNTKLYTGNATNPTTISGIGFQPDWVWTKLRSGGTEAHRLCDAVRGVTKDLFSDATDGEATNTIGLKSFNSDGYVIGNSNGYNLNSGTFVSWNWLASNTTASNTQGDITSTVSANTTSGFSIVSYTGNNSAGATVGHGLGAVPKWFIVKRRNASGGWVVYNEALGNTKIIELHDTSASQTSSAAWNNTSPSSTTFTLGDYTSTNTSGGTYIAYCFAEKKGYSKFGSYQGNSSNDGTFVYTGFRPAFVMIKSSSDSSTWHLADNKRIGYNPLNYRAQPNNSNAEYTGVEIYSDFLSNGFKLRNTDTDTNGARTYIYMAFAEAPFVTSTGIPTTAR